MTKETPATRGTGAEDAGDRGLPASDRRGLLRHDRPTYARLEHLEEVIDRFAAYGQTTTSIMQSTPVADRGLAPES
jgi:hypothetical protein